MSTNTPGTTRLFHRKAEDLGHVRLSGHFREACTLSEVLADTEAQLGALPPAPPKIEPGRAGQNWITSAFLDYVWPRCRPDVTIVSFGEPDVTSHFYAGADQTRSIIAYCDRQSGRVLDWWVEEGKAAGVQLFALADHGHIAGHTRISVAGSLPAAGFSPGTAPGPGVDVVVVSGQVGALYLDEMDEATLVRLVASLTAEPWCGPIFTRADEVNGIASGSLSKRLVFADHIQAPDAAFSFRTDDSDDAFGLEGGTFYDNDRRTGLGLHGGLHPKELAAVGIASSSLPSGICDIAPTILHLLGVSATPTMSGRVLHEALALAPNLITRARKSLRPGLGTIARFFGASMLAVRAISPAAGSNVGALRRTSSRAPIMPRLRDL
ncbi:hypothetical protein ABIB73_005284 [Bradyrhizobium sp. F1.4.3]|uniref:alkaline phosphatase family protein n=1 Tax=unclassified Bradyrhizobium TaxID=2631580 RepID=UPI003399F5E4